MATYVSVSLPIKMIQKIDELKNKHQYSSRPDFVKEAVRHWIKKLEQGR